MNCQRKNKRSPDYNVYNIIDGMEGDLVKDETNVFNGQRMVNGWKNSGCPWTYHLAPELMVLPDIHEDVLK